MPGEPFCCICGKTGIFQENICPECREAELSEELPKEKGDRVLRCRWCKRIFRRGGWRKVPENKTFEYKNAKCPDCHKKDSHHFTTVLKFVVEELTPERKALVEEMARKVIAEENSRGKVTALTRRNPDKAEYYFTHVSTARSIVRRLARGQPVQTREDSKLIGYEHSEGHGKYKRSILVKFLS